MRRESQVCRVVELVWVGSCLSGETMVTRGIRDEETTYKELKMSDKKLGTKELNAELIRH
jgi:hypothetical protein